MLPLSLPYTIVLPLAVFTVLHYLLPLCYLYFNNHYAILYLATVALFFYHCVTFTFLPLYYYVLLCNIKSLPFCYYNNTLLHNVMIYFLVLLSCAVSGCVGFC